MTTQPQMPDKIYAAAPFNDKTIGVWQSKQVEEHDIHPYVSLTLYKEAIEALENVFMGDVDPDCKCDACKVLTKSKSIL